MKHLLPLMQVSVTRWNLCVDGQASLQPPDSSFVVAPGSLVD